MSEYKGMVLGGPVDGRLYSCASDRLRVPYAIYQTAEYYDDRTDPSNMPKVSEFTYKFIHCNGGYHFWIPVDVKNSYAYIFRRLTHGYHAKQAQSMEK